MKSLSNKNKTLLSFFSKEVKIKVLPVASNEQNFGTHAFKKISLGLEDPFLSIIIELVYI